MQHDYNAGGESRQGQLKTECAQCCKADIDAPGGVCFFQGANILLCRSDRHSQCRHVVYFGTDVSFCRCPSRVFLAMIRLPEATNRTAVAKPADNHGRNRK